MSLTNQSVTPSPQEESVKDSYRAPSGPWRKLWRGILSSPTGIISGLGLILLVVAVLMAPLYAHYVSKTNPFEPGFSQHIEIHGKSIPVMQQSTQGLGLGVTPIGPTWHGQYLLGADSQGRDVMARLLYGGQNSLLIAAAATVICLILASIVGIVAGYFGGITDGVLSNLVDIMWAFPVYLLAITLSILMIGKTFDIGPFHVSSGSLFIPIMIIGVVYVPYVSTYPRKSSFH